MTNNNRRDFLKSGIAPAALALAADASGFDLSDPIPASRTCCS